MSEETVDTPIVQASAVTAAAPSDTELETSGDLPEATSDTPAGSIENLVSVTSAVDSAVERSGDLDEASASTPGFQGTVETSNAETETPLSNLREDIPLGHRDVEVCISTDKSSGMDDLGGLVTAPSSMEIESAVKLSAEEVDVANRTIAFNENSQSVVVENGKAGEDNFDEQTAIEKSQEKENVAESFPPVCRLSHDNVDAVSKGKVEESSTLSGKGASPTPTKSFLSTTGADSPVPELASTMSDDLISSPGESIATDDFNPSQLDSAPKVIVPGPLDTSKPSWSAVAKTQSTHVRQYQQPKLLPKENELNKDEHVPKKQVLVSRKSIELEAPSPFFKVDEKKRSGRQEKAGSGLVVLHSGLSIIPQVISNQENAFRILDEYQIMFSRIDGADASNKRIRDKLFKISGMKAVYPQLFLLDDNTYTFWGDFARLEKCGEKEILDTFPKIEKISSIMPNGKTSSDTSISEKPSRSSKSVKEVRMATKDSDSANKETTVCTAKPEKSNRVLVLVSNQSVDQSVKSKQDRLKVILNGRKVSYDLLDGADPNNKERRTALFRTSGLTAKYPQVFLVENGVTMFWGDFDRLEGSNEMGTLVKDLENAAPMAGQAVSTSGTSSRSGDEKNDEAIENASQVASLTEPAKSAKRGKHRGSSTVDSTQQKAQEGEKPSNEIESDITVYGASSFVARHVILYLLQSSLSLNTRLKVTLAARNPEKLSVLEKQWNEKAKSLLEIYPESTGSSEFDAFKAEASDKEAIKRMVRRTKVIISCAGPFSKYSTNVVASCAECGTDYVDITGEVHWVSEMREKFGPMAAKSGCRIVPMCGFDSIPSDIGVYLATKLLKKGKPNASVACATSWHYPFGMANGGTIHTVSIWIFLSLPQLFKTF